MLTVKLKIIEGPYKGISYKLISHKITIGRNPDNDIVLEKDLKCSRKQAIIQLDFKKKYFIKDLSNRSSLKINDIVKLRANLQNGDLVQFGNTVLQYETTTDSTNLPQNSKESSQALAPATIKPLQSSTLPTNDEQTIPLKNNPAPNQNYQNHYGSIPTNNAYNTPPKKKSGGVFKIILIIFIALGAYLFLDQPSDKNSKNKKDLLRTKQDINDDLNTLKEIREKAQKKKNKNLLPSYKNAQAAFITGRRDYRKGVYSRAIEAFRVCKTLYPKHELCHSYLGKSKIKNQQLIQSWMIAGKAYRKRRRYVSCISAFKNVMITIQNKQNLIYREAAQNYKICKIKYANRN